MTELFPFPISKKRLRQHIFTFKDWLTIYFLVEIDFLYNVLEYYAITNEILPKLRVTFL